jgi:hypothetical protein
MDLLWINFSRTRAANCPQLSIAMIHEWEDWSMENYIPSEQ